MAVLEQQTGGTRHTLGTRNLVGRAGYCGIRIRSPYVSGEHASLWWTGTSWKVRDLDSRNGTFVNGERLKTGVMPTIEAGSELAFGSKEMVWRLVDDTPPAAMARPVAGGPAQVEDGGLLAIPSSDDPDLTIFLGPMGEWVAEEETNTRVVHDQEVVAAGGETWRLLLPEVLDVTREPDATRPNLLDLSMAFRVSLDEEYVEVILSHPAKTVTLKPRAYHYLLLTLARQRQGDGELSLSEQGWVYMEDLTRMLRVDRRTLNVHICRARQQVGRAGVEGAAGVIERRASTSQVRLGISELRIERL